MNEQLSGALLSNAAVHKALAGVQPTGLRPGFCGSVIAPQLAIMYVLTYIPARPTNCTLYSLCSDDIMQLSDRVHAAGLGRPATVLQTSFVLCNARLSGSWQSVAV
jgi:hypothetical protein